ncbi:hypothetical protein BH09BAC1_BH09BAC1_15220 [soil metagenome]
MKRLSSLLWLILLVPMLSVAQRYQTEVFTNVTMTPNVKYGENFSDLSGPYTLIDLLMDVYEPTGDTLSKRPVILLFHAGSFLPKGPFLPFGDKRDSLMIEMATQFAKRGFVVASVEYRVGWNPISGNQAAKAQSIINAVYRAMQDGRAAVRWFRKDAATTNQFKIDPYQVIAGGSNSGAYLALAIGNLNKPSEINLLKFRDPVSGKSFIDTTVHGGFYGQGGDGHFNKLNNPGYSSVVQCVLNLGGAVGDTSWMEAGEPPVISFHGVADRLTPFGTNIVYVSATGDPVVEVSGGADIARRQNNLGNNDIWINENFNDNITQIAEGRTPAYEGLYWFAEGYGQNANANGFEPWGWYSNFEPKAINASNAATNNVNVTLFPPPYTGFGSAANPYASRAKAMVYLDTIMKYSVPRLLVALEPQNIDSMAVQTADPATAPTVGVDNIAAINSILNVYPNPASTQLNLSLAAATYGMEKIQIFDITGRLVFTDSNMADPQYHNVSLMSLNSGTYIVTISFSTGEQVSKRLLVH